MAEAGYESDDTLEDVRTSLIRSLRASVFQKRPDWQAPWADEDPPYRVAWPLMSPRGGGVLCRGSASVRQPLLRRPLLGPRRYPLLPPPVLVDTDIDDADALQDAGLRAPSIFKHLTVGGNSSAVGKGADAADYYQQHSTHRSSVTTTRSNQKNVPIPHSKSRSPESVNSASVGLKKKARDKWSRVEHESSDSESDSDSDSRSTTSNKSSSSAELKKQSTASNSDDSDQEQIDKTEVTESVLIETTPTISAVETTNRSASDTADGGALTEQATSTEMQEEDDKIMEETYESIEFLDGLATPIVTLPATTTYGVGDTEQTTTDPTPNDDSKVADVNKNDTPTKVPQTNSHKKRDSKERQKRRKDDRRRSSTSSFSLQSKSSSSRSRSSPDSDRRRRRRELRRSPLPHSPAKRRRATTPVRHAPPAENYQRVTNAPPYPRGRFVAPLSRGTTHHRGTGRQLPPQSLVRSPEQPRPFYTSGGRLVVPAPLLNDGRRRPNFSRGRDAAPPWLKPPQFAQVRYPSPHSMRGTARHPLLPSRRGMSVSPLRPPIETRQHTSPLRYPPASLFGHPVTPLSRSNLVGQQRPLPMSHPKATEEQRSPLMSPPKPGLEQRSPLISPSIVKSMFSDSAGTAQRSSVPTVPSTVPPASPISVPRHGGERSVALPSQRSDYRQRSKHVSPVAPRVNTNAQQMTAQIGSPPPTVTPRAPIAVLASSLHRPDPNYLGQESRDPLLLTPPASERVKSVEEKPKSQLVKRPLPTNSPVRQPAVSAVIPPKAPRLFPKERPQDLRQLLKPKRSFTKQSLIGPNRPVTKMQTVQGKHKPPFQLETRRLSNRRVAQPQSYPANERKTMQPLTGRAMSFQAAINMPTAAARRKGSAIAKRGAALRLGQQQSNLGGRLGGGSVAPAVRVKNDQQTRRVIHFDEEVPHTIPPSTSVVSRRVVTKGNRSFPLPKRVRKPVQV